MSIATTAHATASRAAAAIPVASTTHAVSTAAVGSATHVASASGVSHCVFAGATVWRP